MADPLKCVVTGVSGRMGQMLVQTIDRDARTELVAVLERAGHDWIGQDLGAVLGGAERGVRVSDNVDQSLAEADVVIDFTAPAATLGFARAASAHNVVHIVGTTGFSDKDLSELDGIAETMVMVRAGNMSLGVNLLTVLAEKVAAALDDDFDIEIVEAHHRHKVDAPSGTALMLGEAAAKGRGVALPDMADRGRDGITGERGRGAIGFHAIRGGDVVGEHDVIFAADGERIVLKHLATDRAIFARGAIKAALWATGKPHGLYSMVDVLGL
ncbi:MAG: 4-hydroxy-tetrahydrodipicolinate reductase [Pseudomonadota bacterium]